MLFLELCERSDFLKIIKFVDVLVDVAFVVVPIGLVLMLTVDMVKNVISGDEQAQKKNLNAFLMRIISCAALFLVPTIVTFVISFVDDAIGDGVLNSYNSCIANMDNIDYYENLEKTKKEKAKQEANEKYKQIVNQIKEAEKAALKAAFEKRKQARINSANSASNGSSSNSAGTVAGKTYNLDATSLKKIAAICQREQGDNTDGVKAEASLMANRYEMFGSKYSSINNYVTNSGWFGSATKNAKTNKASDSSIAAVKSVLVNGNRTLSLYVDEHDCISCGSYGYDIKKIVTDGKTITNKKQLLDHDNYKKDNTVIYNKYGAVYTFETFPATNSDPFGYTDRAYKKIKG